MTSTNTHAETLGDRPEVPSHETFIGSLDQHDPSLLPPALMWGSFMGSVDKGEENRQPIAGGNEIGLVFHGSRVVGRVVEGEKQSLIFGRVSITGSADAPRMRVAMSFVRVQGFVSCKVDVGAQPVHMTVDPSELQTIRNRVEIRAEFSSHVQQPDAPPNEHRLVPSAGLVGEWLELSEHDPSVLCRHYVTLHPTPQPQRSAGFFAIEISSPVCGLEHTGTFSHWHGTGAQVRRVQDPSRSLGVRAGDILKMANGVPLPHKTKSTDVSAFIKASSRPLVLHFWRDIWTPTVFKTPSTTPTPADAATPPANTPPPATTPTATRMALTTNTQPIDEDQQQAQSLPPILPSNLSIALPPIHEVAPADPNIPMTASSMGSFRAVTPNRLSRDPSFEEVSDLSTRTKFLRSEMMDEIVKKRQSVDAARQSRHERMAVLSGS